MVHSLHGDESVPQQLKWSKDDNKIKWLHVKGESNQAQEGKHCH